MTVRFSQVIHNVVHCVAKKLSHLMFANNFGKYGPIFKILLLIDS